MTDIPNVGSLALGAKRLLEANDGDPRKEARLDDGLQGVWERAYAVQQDLLQVDNELTREYQRLEREFAQKKRSTYLKRNELLRHIDSFWCTALANSAVSAYLSELDKGLLYYLEALEVSPPDENESYSIQLEFSQDNPIFATPVLRRHLQRNPATGLVTVTCDDFAWKRDLQAEVDPDGKPLLEQYSFLSWFLGQGEYSDDEVDEIAEEIRNAIWLNPLHFFIGGDEELDLELQQDGAAANAAELDDDDDGDAAIAALASEAGLDDADEDDDDGPTGYSDEDGAEGDDPGTPPEEGDEEDEEDEEADGDDADAL